MDENKMNATQETDNTNTEELNEGQRTYTQEEVDALLQTETDRRVTSALKKAEEKNKAKVREAEKLSAMNAQQKFEYELEQREQAIKEKEAELTLAENKSEASKILADKNISQDLVELVVAEDAETMNANIALLDKAFKVSVKAEVERRLGSNSPKKNLPTDQTITKEAFRKMTLSEQQELYNNNPEIYKALTT